MEGKAASGSSSSPSPPLPSELFGRKDPGLFDSVFSPPLSSAQVVGRVSQRSVGIGSPRIQEHANRLVYTQSTTHKGQGSQEGKTKELPILNKERSSIFLNEKPGNFSLSNSLYYGGQDICVQPPRPSESSTNYKDDGEDDLGKFAHRGDWWQGSLYY